MQIRFAENKDVPGILTLLRQVGAVHHDLRPAFSGKMPANTALLSFFP